MDICKNVYAVCVLMMNEIYFRMYLKKAIQVMALLMAAVLPLSAQEWTSPHPLSVEKAAPVALLPFPQEVKWKGIAALPKRGDWKLIKPEKIGGEMVKVAWEGLLAELPEGSGDTPMVCRLKTDPKAAGGAAEGYELSVSGKKVQVSAATEAGFFYGLQTLRQLVAGGKLPECTIRDWPAFDVRGFMLDCGRNFQSIESLKRQLDLAARLKVNYFHWHITDHPAWHLECRKYPALNAPEHRTRDPHDTYTYDQVRELIAYAKARHITIIPELDMPGHSAFFKRAFGFEMHSEEGMQVLEELLDEFCAEVSAEDCPIIHIGADEVRIPNAHQFVERMSRKLISLKRTPMQWGGPRDLPVGKDSICQRWGEGGDMVARSLKPETVQCRSIDSTPGYTNLFDPAMLVRRWFFMRPCGVAKGDEKKMGVLICTWPDIRVEDKSGIPLQSAQWPGMCAMAERAWVGGAADGDAFPTDMPEPRTEAARAFALFEKRVEGMRNTVFKGEHFPYWTEKALKWTLTEPVSADAVEASRSKALSAGMKGLSTRTVYGANLYFRTKPNIGCLGFFPNAKPGVCVWAATELRVDEDGEYPFMIGFDSPARSSRRCSGVPAAGEWSQCGTRIWLNGVEIKNPQVYRLAGKNRFPKDTWTSPANELPLSHEELWWAREPTMLPLKKGKNTIVIEQPYVGEFQSWGISLIPLNKNAKDTE